MTEQGDLKLLDEPAARRLLASTELARLAYIAPDGMGRIVLRPSWVGLIDFQQHIPRAMAEALS